jgi:HEPN domain-containing protein
MAPDELVNEWLKKAEEDYGFASLTLADPAINYYAQICFHFQQAAEKYLKAYIVAFQLEFKKIHDLSELLNICTKKSSALTTLAECCNFLTDYYIDTRYPVHWPAAMSREEAQKAKTATKTIRDTILKALNRNQPLS